MPIPILSNDDDYTPFPNVDSALASPNGLLMAGGSLSDSRLITAYRNGIFPWYEEGEPILWWSPDPRCILWPDQIRVRRSLAKVIRRGDYELTRNVAFVEVMKNCARLRAGSTGTWITAAMLQAYTRLHQLGYAQSLEVWQEDRLVGGLYGVVTGSVFVGESMFSTARDASKIALVALAKSGDYQLIDCQLETPHLTSMGAQCIARDDYLELLIKYRGTSANRIDEQLLAMDRGPLPAPDL